MSTARRSLSDTRTVAGRPTAPGSQQKIYMRLCTLQMERNRREQELRVARERAETAGRRVSILTEQINDLVRVIANDNDLNLTKTIDRNAPLGHRYGARRTRRTKGANS